MVDEFGRDAFERACDEASKEVKTDDESVIEWVRGCKTATVCAYNGGKLKNRILKLAESNPEDVEICTKNNDGTIVAHVPVSWIRIKPPRLSTFTEEQKAAGAERLRKWREQQAITNVESDDSDSLEEP